MGREIYEASAAARSAFEVVSEAVGSDMRAVCFELDEDMLRQTNHAQIALYTVGVATYEALREAGAAAPSVAAGHSVGEYAALAAAGHISHADGARLVARRGDLMARSGNLRKGGMAAVLGMDDDALESLCAEISKDGHVVVPANFNCAGQIVISGDEGAVLEVCEKAKAAGAKRCIPLNVSGAFHSPLMHEAAAAMAEALSGVEFADSPIPVVANVTAKTETDWRALLEEQLRAPVRWAASVRHMLSFASTFVECGPGDVLTGLLRRIEPSATGMSIGSPEALTGAATQLV